MSAGIADLAGRPVVIGGGLAGLMVAYPQPAASSCSVEGGSWNGPPNSGNRFVGTGEPAGRGMPSPKNPPNIINTGTGVFALAGVTVVIRMSTVIAGQAELSTCPISRLPFAGKLPTSPPVTFETTVQVTFGTLAGTQPTTSRSKSSTISGRRRFHHISAVLTF